MAGISTTAKVKSATISARIIRANGKVEDLGVISRSSKEGILKRIIKKLRGK